MGRKKTLDRDKLLDVVASIVSNGGVSALTIDGVAKAAGISKGGVQATFGTKEQIIKEVFDYCQQSVDARLMPVLQKTDAEENWVLSYLDFIAQVDEPAGVTAAGVFAAMAKTPIYREDLHKRYADRLHNMETSGGVESNMRLVFLAIHGAFFLRHFGFMSIPAEQWTQMFADIRALALSSTPIDPPKPKTTSSEYASDNIEKPQTRRKPTKLRAPPR